MNKPIERRELLLAAASLGAMGIIAGCSSSPPPQQAEAVPTPAPAATPPIPRVAEAAKPKVSQATTPRAYRRDAASHLYGQNSQRIYKGMMPPLLYAIGVLQVELDARGNVLHTDWMRAPKHAPEVIAEIERTVRQAAPFPAPVRMGRVVYTDTWLWHKSGNFQLDTLTEGQA